MVEDDGVVRVDGVELFYRVSGAGAPLLLIHAANTDSRMWDRVARGLSQHNRVVRYDMRGMGRSQGGPESYTVVADIDAVFEECGVDACTVVGTSAGGACALEYALARPHRVAGLVLVSAGLFGVEIPESEAHRRDSSRLAEAVAGGDAEAMAEVYAEMWLDGPGQAPERVTAATRELFLAMARTAFERRAEFRFPDLASPPAAERLDEIDCPTLVVDGELDYEESCAFATFLAGKIRGAERVSLPGVAHLPPLEEPESFTRLLEAFLASRVKSPGSRSATTAKTARQGRV